MNYRSRQGETLSFIAWQHYGQSSGFVEMLLDVNPHLAKLPAVLPMNTIVFLPEESSIQTIADLTNETINLWT